MRASICVERAGSIYRLAWLNESQNGIYWGVLGSDRDYHLSYHADGARHFRAGRERLLPDADIPVKANRRFRQLANANVSLSSEWLNARTLYSPKVGETVITLPEAQSVEGDSLLVDYWLVERACEEEFRAGRWQEPSRAATIFTLGLEHFPSHLLGVGLEAAHTRS